MVDKYYQAHKP